MGGDTCRNSQGSQVVPSGCDRRGFEKPRVALIFSPSTIGLLLLVALPGPSSSANKPLPLAFVREVKSLLWRSPLLQTLLSSLKSLEMSTSERVSENSQDQLLTGIFCNKSSGPMVCSIEGGSSKMGAMVKWPCFGSYKEVEWDILTNSTFLHFCLVCYLIT